MILFFGGEPLLRYDLLKRIVLYAEQEASAVDKYLVFDMTTNGTLMTEEKAAFLRDHKVKYLVSIDGVGDDHNRHRHYADGTGSFAAIKSRLPLMKRYQPWMGAKMSVTPEVCPRLADNIADLFRLGINQFIIGYAHGIKWSLEQLVQYEKALKDVCDLYLSMKAQNKPFRMTLFEEGEPGKEEAKKDLFGCGAGRGRFCVDSRGDIYGCSKLATITGMGNGVLPFGNTQQGQVRIENRFKFLVPDIGPRKKCSQCEFRYTCSGGCPAINYAATGSVYDPDDLSCRIVFITRRIHAYMRQRRAAQVN